MSKKLALAVMICAMLLAAQSSLTYAAENNTEVHSYDLVMSGKVEMILDGERANLDSTSTLSYTNKRTREKLEVFCNALKLNANKDGSVVMEVGMDKTGVTGKGGKLLYSADNGTDAQKQYLQETFERPMATIELDGDGRELKRSVSTAKEAQAVIQTGQVQNMRLFHLPYIASAKAWKATVEISMGGGGIASGDLNLEKTTLDGNLQSVSVSGTLSNPNFVRPNNMITKNAIYEISGTQTYDSAAREWVSGKWTAKIKLDLAKDNLVGSASGTMQFELVSRK